MIRLFLSLTPPTPTVVQHKCQIAFCSKSKATEIVFTTMKKKGDDLN